MSEMKPDRYASRSDGDSIEELSKRLTADLRRHIRGLVRTAHNPQHHGLAPFAVAVNFLTVMFFFCSVG